MYALYQCYYNDNLATNTFRPKHSILLHSSDPFNTR